MATLILEIVHFSPLWLKISVFHRTSIHPRWALLPQCMLAEQKSPQVHTSQEEKLMLADPSS